MIFRDTGDFDSFIIASVLPLKEESETGDFFPFHKMGFSVMRASRYKVMLDRDLTGEFSLHLSNFPVSLL